MVGSLIYAMSCVPILICLSWVVSKLSRRLENPTNTARAIVVKGKWSFHIWKTKRSRIRLSLSSYDGESEYAA